MKEKIRDFILDIAWWINNNMMEILMGIIVLAAIGLIVKTILIFIV